MAEHPFIEVVRLSGALYLDHDWARWFNSPQPLLGNSTPLELLAQGRSHELLAVLQSLDAGVYL